MMSYETFLARIVEDGKAGARRDYRPGDKLDGSLAGFDHCAGKTPEQLAAVLVDARADASEAHRAEAANYWYWRCREAEIEWVCNVVSAMLMNEGLPTIIPPTARGVTKAAEILGVAEPSQIDPNSSPEFRIVDETHSWTAAETEDRFRQLRSRGNEGSDGD